MGNRIQHYAGLHMRTLDQIGANFEDHKSNYRYSYLFDRAPDDPAADQYIADAPKRKKNQQKSTKPQIQPKSEKHLSVDTRKKAKPIQQTLFADVLENGREALVFDLLIETMEPGRCCAFRSQKILLIYKAEPFDPSVLTKEQYRLYQIGQINHRLLRYPAQEPAAQNMLKQHVTKKTFGYETKNGKHLVTIRAWK